MATCVMDAKRPTGEMGSLAKTLAVESLCQAIVCQWTDLAQRPEPVVIATSGGSDSVGLALAAARVRSKQCRNPLVIAHFNHRWRGAQSDADADWVAQFADSLGLACQIGTANSGDQTSEENARNQRYRFLQQVADRWGARYVATAHTRDDVVETVLMRLLRGTGLRGLCGIPVRRQLSSDVTLVRPLLSVSKSKIETALREIGQDWRIDSSNATQQFTRNWLRNGLLPQIRERLPHDVDEAIGNLSRQAAEWSDWHAVLAVELANRHATLTIDQNGQRVQVDTKGLLDESVAGAPIPSVLVREVARAIWQQAGWPLQAMGQVQWLQVEAAFRAQHLPAQELPGGIRISRESERCMLAGP